MMLPFGAREISRAVNALTPAGPAAAPTMAAAVVARLRKATRWSTRYLDELTGLHDAAEAVAASPTLIVDRHGLTRAVAPLLEDSLPVSTLADARIRFLTLRLLSREATGLWDPRRHRRLLVAPNVLVDAHRFSLDQGDWCKWVALRAGLWGVLIEHAPFLYDRATDKDGLADFIRNLELVDAIVRAQMDGLTTSDLSSVQWLRSYREYSSVGILIDAISTFAGKAGKSRAWTRNNMRVFAGRAVSESLVPRLLSSPDALPTPTEILDPGAWRARVR